jgi:hypothetical protein
LLKNPFLFLKKPILVPIWLFEIQFFYPTGFTGLPGFLCLSRRKAQTNHPAAKDPSFRWERNSAAQNQGSLRKKHANPVNPVRKLFIRLKCYLFLNPRILNCYATPFLIFLKGIFSTQ